MKSFTNFIYIYIHTYTHTHTHKMYYVLTLHVCRGDTINKT